MKKATFILLFLFCLTNISLAQEIRASVKVSAQHVEGLDQNTVRALELIIREVLSNTKWTSIPYQKDEKVNISLAMVITSVGANDKNDIKANIDFVVSRTVYDSNYLSPLVSYHDKNVAFYFDDWQDNTYKANAFTSGLMSMISYYALTAIAIDQMSLSEDGGMKFLSQAMQAASIAESNGVEGFKEAKGSSDRVMLAADLQSPSFDGFRKAFYKYHRQGLDMMAGNVLQAKRNIADAIIAMEPTARRNINSLLIRAMIEAKATEIEGIFSSGAELKDMDVVRESLKVIAPSESSRWDRLQ